MSPLVRKIDELACRGAVAEAEERLIGAATREVGPTAQRFQLWVDGVGGFLVCLGEEISFGQAPHVTDRSGAPGPAVPLLGDVSRRHAVIRRDGDGYLLIAVGPTRVGGKPVKGVAPLSNGDEIHFSERLGFRFLQPNRLSGTARLEPIGRGRTQPTADAVLMMAETLILGPNTNAHIVCRDWPRDLVLFRREDQLACRAGGPIDIDDEARPKGAGPITLNSRISSEEFRVTLEAMTEA